MLIDPPYQIVRHANIERAADFAGEDVDPLTAFVAHAGHSGVTGSSAFADDDTEFIA
jgi:hypothetical protein